MLSERSRMTLANFKLGVLPVCSWPGPGSETLGIREMHE